MIRRKSVDTIRVRVKISLKKRPNIWLHLHLNLILLEIQIIYCKTGRGPYMGFDVCHQSFGKT